MICLQGGAEFGPLGAAMDTELLRLAGDGPVVIVALAGAPGREYETAGRGGVSHFAALGAPSVVAAPDAREDEPAAYAVAREAALLVLPGGSPARLLAALTTTRLGLAVEEVLDRGGVVMGASAGAMVLASHTWLPDRGGAVVPGLGLVADSLVVPHWQEGAEQRVAAVRSELAEEVLVLGLPEQSGVLVHEQHVTAVGHAGSTLAGVASTTVLAVGSSAPLVRGEGIEP